MALTDITIRASKPKQKPYKLSDSEGLYLLVQPNGSKLWYLKFRFQGKESRLAFGPYPHTSLAFAREQKNKAKELLAQGINPSDDKRENKYANEKSITFEQIAKEWHSTNQKWSETYAKKILRSLETYIFPHIGKHPITILKTYDLLSPIKQVEKLGYLEIAARLQQRVSAIMRYAVQNGVINYNPAQEMAGAITTAKRTHRPALDFKRIPELLSRIEHCSSRELTQLTIKLMLLVFVRSSELRFARWTEIDFERALWTIPAEREAIKQVKYSARGAKMQTPHLVPLSQQAILLLQEIHKISGEYELVFIGDHHPNRPMSENTVNKALRTMGYDTKTEVCGHGFRAMACSALIESGLWSKDAVERQMSHQERNGVRAAYIHKAEHIEERKLMLQWWADYLDANREQHITPYEFAKLGTV